MKRILRVSLMTNEWPVILRRLPACTYPWGPPHSPKESLVCIVMFVFFSLVSVFILCTSAFRQEKKSPATGTPSEHVGRGPGVMRTVWREESARGIAFSGSGLNDSTGVRQMFFFVRTYR